MINDRFEYPLPILDLDIDELFIETKDNFNGRFTIKNTGGDMLSGHILSRHPAITFEPSTWEGNLVDINYHFSLTDAGGFRPGDTLESSAYICSNGGEVHLPIMVKLIKMAISTREGNVIANVQDFYEYAQRYPSQARRLFTDSEFYMLLLAIGYEYMEIYESLHKDSNRDRAMDNFFILSGLKGKTTLKLQQHQLEFIQKPHETSMIYGQFLVQKSDNGYFESPISMRTSVPWLMLPISRLISSDFNDANTAMVQFSIDPLQVSGRYARELIYVGSELEPDYSNAIEVIFKRDIPLTIQLNRESFRYEDKGVIEIINNTGLELRLSLFCQDSYVRFAAREYIVGAYYEIPFNIKLSAFMNASLLFRKQPYMRSAIEVRSVRGLAYKIRLPLTVGEW